MTKREKRLLKGIESLNKTIKEHEIRRADALANGKIDLTDYYGKEIEALKKRKKSREDKLNRS